MRTAYLEIGSLFEDTWTGIPNVIAAIAREAIKDPAIDWRFLFETVEVPLDLVTRFLAQHSGVGGLQAMEQVVWDRKPVSMEEAAEGVCVYTNIKPMRRYFGREASIVHDISPMLTPQFHNADNINHFADRIRQDVETSDHIFPVSRATMNDVHTYFGMPYEKMSVIELGVDFDPADLTNAHLGLRPELKAEPYIVVLGTLEPRKNGQIVLDYVARNPGFANQYRVVFVGRDGWLDGREKLLRVLREANVAPDRVLFTGYVSEADKVALLLNAAFAVYPSFFEGFGLPVLEVGALGKTTVCSNSSSIPEVFPDACVFFNPADSFEFDRAMRIAELRAYQSRSSTQSVSDIMARAAPYSWSRCYPGIARWIAEQ